MLYTIKEVAQMFDVKQSMLRYWEKKFPSIKPIKTENGARRYRKEDIDEIRLIYYLLKEKKLTLPGAKQKLKENRENIIRTEEIASRLGIVRDELMKLKAEFDELDKEYTEAVEKTTPPFQNPPIS